MKVGDVLWINCKLFRITSFQSADLVVLHRVSTGGHVTLSREAVDILLKIYLKFHQRSLATTA